MVIGVLDINTDTDCSKVTVRDKVFSCSFDLDISVALGGSMWPLDPYGSGCSVALGSNTGGPR